MAGEQNTRNPEPKELVGSKDLRESFKEHDRIRGSFFINGVEIHQMDANSPASVVSQINARSTGHFVSAEIDDGGHLVLIDQSGAPIMVTPGAPYVDTAATTSTGDAARDALNHLKNAAKEDGGKKDKPPSVLEMLGLDGAHEEQADQPGGARAGFETGRSAEDRRKAREEAAGRVGASGTPVNVNQPAGGLAGSGIDRSFAPQIPSNPTPGATSGAGGKLDDGRGRTGTGGGSGETSAATVQRQHAPSRDRPAPVPGA